MVDDNRRTPPPGMNPDLFFGNAWYNEEDNMTLAAQERRRQQQEENPSHKGGDSGTRLKHGTQGTRPSPKIRGDQPQNAQPFITGATQSSARNPDQSPSNSEKAITRDMLNKQLIQAVKDGDIEGVEIALARGAYVDARDTDGSTPIIIAARTENADINTQLVTMLLQNNANPNAKDKDGNTALMAASEKKNLASMGHLCEHGANINATNKEGLTALLYTQDPTRIYDDLLDYGDSLLGYEQAASFLLEHGANPAIGTDSWPTYRRASAELIRAFMAKGADINATDENGETRLLQVAGRVVTPLEATLDFNTLIECGADVNEPNNNGITPLMRVVEETVNNIDKLFDRSSEQQLDTLIQHGADVCAVSLDNKTALSIALELDNPHCISVLAAQDYTKLRDTHPEVFAAQEAALQEWAAQSPKNAEILRQAQERSAQEPEQAGIGTTERLRASGAKPVQETPELANAQTRIDNSNSLG